MPVYQGSYQRLSNITFAFLSVKLLMLNGHHENSLMYYLDESTKCVVTCLRSFILAQRMRTLGFQSQVCYLHTTHMPNHGMHIL